MKPRLYDGFGNSVAYKIPPPSEKFIDKSETLSPEARIRIIDLAAKYLSQNNCFPPGRVTMCLQFAILVKFMLHKEGVETNLIEGIATYQSGKEILTWEHTWLETKSGEIIDCNIDSVIYHPDCPENIGPHNYWGALTAIPADRIFRKKKVLRRE